MMNDAELARLFVAITIPQAVKAELARVQHELRATLPARAMAWTKLDNLHLTLRFLGDVLISRIVELDRDFRAAVTGFGELEVRCERLGCFPDLRFPRVVWAGVQDEANRLTALWRRVNEAVAPFAEMPAENAFTGHITLGRPRRMHRTDAEQLARFIGTQARRQFGSWRASEVALIRSELSPGGSRYTTLASAQLAP